MEYLYGYLSQTPSAVGAVVGVVVTANGQQSLTKEASKLIYELLSNRKATLSGSLLGSTGFALEPGYNAEADAWASLYYVQTEPPASATPTDLSKAKYLLVDIEAAEKNIAGIPTDVAIVIAKDEQVAKQLTNPGSMLASLTPLSVALAEEKKPAGIKPAAIVGAAIGAGVGALVGGVPGALIGGIGAGVLVQQVA